MNSIAPAEPESTPPTRRQGLLAELSSNHAYTFGLGALAAAACCLISRRRSGRGRRHETSAQSGAKPLCEDPEAHVTPPDEDCEWRDGGAKDGDDSGIKSDDKSKVSRPRRAARPQRGRGRRPGPEAQPIMNETGPGSWQAGHVEL